MKVTNSPTGNALSDVMSASELAEAYARVRVALEKVRSYAQHNGMFPDGLSKRQMMADVEDIARDGLGLPKANRVQFK